MQTRCPLSPQPFVLSVSVRHVRSSAAPLLVVTGRSAAVRGFAAAVHDGHEAWPVVWCPTSAKAQRHLAGGRYRAVLLDLDRCVPEELPGWLHAAAVGNTPLLVLADERTQDLAFAALRLGAAGFLYEPQLANHAAVAAALGHIDDTAEPMLALAGTA